MNSTLEECSAVVGRLFKGLSSSLLVEFSLDFTATNMLIFHQLPSLSVLSGVEIIQHNDYLNYRLQLQTTQLQYPHVSSTQQVLLTREEGELLHVIHSNAETIINTRPWEKEIFLSTSYTRGRRIFSCILDAVCEGTSSIYPWHHRQAVRRRARRFKFPATIIILKMEDFSFQEVDGRRMPTKSVEKIYILNLETLSMISQAFENHPARMPSYNVCLLSFVSPQSTFNNGECSRIYEYASLAFYRSLATAGLFLFSRNSYSPHQLFSYCKCFACGIVFHVPELYLYYSECSSERKSSFAFHLHQSHRPLCRYFKFLIHKLKSSEKPLITFVNNLPSACYLSMSGIHDVVHFSVNKNIITQDVIFKYWKHNENV